MRAGLMCVLRFKTSRVAIFIDSNTVFQACVPQMDTILCPNLALGRSTLQSPLVSGPVFPGEDFLFMKSCNK